MSHYTIPPHSVPWLSVSICPCLLQESGESGKKSRIFAALSTDLDPCFSLKDGHPALASSGLALHGAMRPRISRKSVLGTAASANWNTTSREGSRDPGLQGECKEGTARSCRAGPSLLYGKKKSSLWEVDAVALSWGVGYSSRPINTSLASCLTVRTCCNSVRAWARFCWAVARA